MCADRKLSRENLPSRQCLNELLFRPLGVTGGKHFQFDTGILRKKVFNLGNCFLLVVLYRENCPFGLQNPAKNLHSTQHLLRICSEQRIIRRNIGLAFAGVGDHGIYFPNRGKGFHISRESRAAHADNSGLPDQAENGIRIHCLSILAGCPQWNGGILKIIFNHNRIYRFA